MPDSGLGTFVPTHPAFARSVGELLVDAETLLDEGRFILAAMTSRAALDSWLRSLHAEHRLPRPKRDKIGEFAALLFKADVIDLATRGTICRLARIGGRAVHNEPVSSDEVFYIVSTVQALCAGGVH